MNSSNNLKLKGIIPPILTPLRKDGKVDTIGLRNLTRHLITCGVHGIFAMGTAGESPMLSREQRRDALITIREESKGNVPLLVGIMETSTTRCLELVREAEEIGAEALVVNSPYYFHVSQAEIIKHCLAIKDATELPIVLYNIPKYTGNPLHVETINYLARVPGVVAYKDSSSNMTQFQEVLRLTQDLPNFAVFQGNHLLSIPSLLIGASGIVPGVGNIIPKEMVGLYDAVLAGDLDKAYHYHDLVAKVEAYFTQGDYSLAMMKGMVEVLGFTDECVPHSPLPPLSDAKKLELKEFFQLENIVGYTNN